MICQVGPLTSTNPKQSSHYLRLPHNTTSPQHSVIPNSSFRFSTDKESYPIPQDASYLQHAPISRPYGVADSKPPASDVFHKDGTLLWQGQYRYVSSPPPRPRISTVYAQAL